MLAGHVPSDCNLNMLGEHRGTSLKIMVNKYFARQDIPVKCFQPLQKYLEIVKLKLIIMHSTASISIHVWDILQAADKFKASLLELGKFSLRLTSHRLGLNEDSLGPEIEVRANNVDQRTLRTSGKYLQTMNVRQHLCWAPRDKCRTKPERKNLYHVNSA